MTPPLRESTTVAIVGGGVSRLTAAALLRSCGIDSIILERQTRAHVEQWGLGDVLQGFPANNFLEIRVDGGGSFRERIMRARLERLLSSDIAARYYAEMFTGLG